MNLRHLLNKNVDSIENNFIKDNVRIRDLISSFITLEIEMKKKHYTFEIVEKRFNVRLIVEINTIWEIRMKNKKIKRMRKILIKKLIKKMNIKKFVGFIGEEVNKQELLFNIVGDVN